MQELGTQQITTLGTIIILIAIFGWLFGFYKVYRSYQETGRKQSQFFSFALLFGGLGMAFLAFEQITLQLFDNNTPDGSTYIPKEVFGGITSDALGFFFGTVAVTFSALSIILFVAFSLSFFENAMKFTVIPIVMMIIYVIYFIISNPTWVLTGTDYDLERLPEQELILFLLIIPSLLLPILVFLITAIQVRGNSFNFRRALALAITMSILDFGYIVEIVGAEGFIIIIGRFFLMIYPFMTWSILNPGNFVRKILGAPN